MTSQAYCEVWENGRRVGSAFYDPDRIAPMQPYCDPRMQHRVTAAAALREMARDSCTPSRYNALTQNRHDDLEGWGDWEPWQGELPDEEVLPLSLPKPLPEPVVVEEPAPIAVPDWPLRPAVVEPEAVPVVVDHTAARFAALEIRRD